MKKYILISFYSKRRTIMAFNQCAYDPTIARTSIKYAELIQALHLDTSY